MQSGFRSSAIARLHYWLMGRGRSFSSPFTKSSGYRQCGFTLIELMIVVAIIGAIAGIAIPQYRSYVERVKVASATVDILMIADQLERYYLDDRSYPATLALLRGAYPAIDPWGNPYQYLAIDIVPPPNQGQLRKDKNLNPLNSDFDLYSMGPDGRTQKPLTSAKGRDDIVRAGNGSFVGVASQH